MLGILRYSQYLVFRVRGCVECPAIIGIVNLGSFYFRFIRLRSKSPNFESMCSGFVRMM